MKNSNTKKISVSVMILALTITSLGLMVPKGYAIASLYITPSVIDNPALGPGSTFTINASASEVVDLFTWQVTIAFNPAVLHCLSASVPVGSPFRFDINPSPIIDNTNGKVSLGSSKIIGPGADGSGVLATFTFNVTGRGFSILNFSQPGVQTFLLDTPQHDISFTVQNGSFNNYVPPPAAKVFVQPPKVVDPTLIPPDTFDVNLSISDATTVQSWVATLFYNNTLLSATNVVEGVFLSNVGTTTFTFTIDNGFNATHGRIQMSCALASGSASGNGQLAGVTFQVLDFGSTDLTVADVDLRDPSNNALPFTTQNGYFNNMLIAKLAIDPAEVSGPEYIPGATFEINVTLDDVDGLKTCIFNLTYIPAVIQEINIITPSVLGQTPTKKLQVDDDSGYIWANLTYRNGVSTVEPVTVMTVEFQVVAMGISPINLTQTQMLSLTDQEITHEVYHGIFIGLIRDVAVLAVVPELNIVYQNWTIGINVTVRNNGNVTETFDVKVFYNDTGIGGLGGIGTVTDLLPQQETTITIMWDTTGVEWCHNYTITATAGPVPFEFNLGDNTFEDGKVKVRIPGDVNGDGVVDMRDIGELTNAYGATPDRPNWIFYGDMNRDRRIDLRDIGIACTFFAQHC